MVGKLYVFAVCFRNVNAKCSYWKKSDKNNKNQNSFYVQNNIKQLKNHIKEAFTCLYLAVFT